jgi:hypothetical protein
MHYSYSYPSSKMLAGSPTDVIPKTRQAIAAKKTMMKMFLTGPKP